MRTDQMETEWLAWRKVCESLKALGLDINKEDRLALAIREWGDSLVALRYEQVKAIG